MKSLLVVLALGVAVLAVPGAGRDTKFYDVAKSGHFAALLSSYFEHFYHGEEFKFREDFFHPYPEEDMCEFVVVYKPVGESTLRGIYMRRGKMSHYEDDIFDVLRPFYEYYTSMEFYGLSPLLAKQIAPEYFNAPLKDITYQQYSDVDLESPIPLFFLVPQAEVTEAALKDSVTIEDKRFCKTSKTVTRRQAKEDKASDLPEEEMSSDLAEQDKTSDPIEEKEPLDLPELMPSDLTENNAKDIKNADIIEDFKTSDIFEKIPDLPDLKPSDLTEHDKPLKEIKLPADIAEHDKAIPDDDDPLFDLIDKEDSDHISHDPSDPSLSFYMLFMRDNPYYDRMPDPFFDRIPDPFYDRFPERYYERFPPHHPERFPPHHPERFPPHHPKRFPPHHSDRFPEPYMYFNPHHLGYN